LGHAVARAARQFLNQKRPDIQIVGDDLHPLGKLKDFAPYVAKIKASGAQAVITGNWGNDLVLLIRAAGDAGLELEYFTYYGGALGAPMAIGDVGVGRLKQVSQWISNIDSPRAGERTMAYRKRFKDARDDYYATTHWMVIEMLAKAMQTAGSDDPPAIAKVLEGMRWEGDSGEVIMRADNHQLLQPLVVSTFSKVDGKSVRYDVERTGNGFQVDYRVAAKDTALPTTCKMVRP
jgi:branched-chain amino acid transport system substrate-binding protein